MSQQDTEITLGTGRMLILFSALVLVCALFFSIGFSLGRKTTMANAGLLLVPAGTPATIVRPLAVKSDARDASPASPQSGDFSFYKAVGEKSADTALAPPDSKIQSAVATSTSVAPAAAQNDTIELPAAAPASGSYSGSYYVQVAAVTRQEDAEALVEALKKKQYPAFSANNNSADKFYHVQVGPYAELKQAEVMRARLMGDGYNPIVKK
jgi:cell division septation protein DedD